MLLLLWSFLLVETLLQVFCRSICRNNHMRFSLLNFSLIAEFQVFHPPKEFLPGWIPQCHKTILGLLFSRSNICCCLRYRNWIRACKMIWTVDDSRPINFVRFKTELLVAWRSPGIVETHPVIFSLKEPKTFSLFCFTGWRTDFWGSLQNPNVVIENQCVSRHESFLYNVLSISNISSR